MIMFIAQFMPGQETEEGAQESNRNQTVEEAMDNTHITQARDEVQQQQLADARTTVPELAEQAELPTDIVEELRENPSISKELVYCAQQENQEAFYNTVRDIMSQQQAESLYQETVNHIHDEFLLHLSTIYHKFHGTETGNAMMMVSADMMQGDIARQSQWLQDAGASLDDQQRADMLRAAVDYGFSASSVFNLQRIWNLFDADISGGTTNPGTMNLNQFMTESMRKMLEKLRKTLENSLTNRNEQTTREADEAEHRLAMLVGNRRARQAREMLERQGVESADLVVQTLKEQLELSRNLHSGRLGAVRPTAEPRMT